MIAAQVAAALMSKKRLRNAVWFSVKSFLVNHMEKCLRIRKKTGAPCSPRHAFALLRLFYFLFLLI